MTYKAELHSVTSNSIGWPFHGNGSAKHQAGEGKGYGIDTDLDPFPCYAHEGEPMRSTLKLCEERFAPRTPLYLYRSRFEDTARVNGWATYRELYNDDELPFEVYIFFSGKRTPIHPAQTRYLTAHEYGHAVMYWFMHDMREEDEDGRPEAMHEVEDRLMKEYCDLRGIKFNDNYGGGKWHTNTKEIFANDWRTVIGVETEFWPHRAKQLKPGDAAWKWWEEDVLDV